MYSGLGSNVETGKLRLVAIEMELYFFVNKTKADQQVIKLLQLADDEELKRYNFWTLREEKKSSSDLIFNKFLEQLELKERCRANCFK